MHVLIVSLRGPTAAARRGGAQAYVGALGAAWAAWGHEVTVLCAQERLRDGTTPPGTETLGGVRVRRVGTPEARVRPLVRAAREMAPTADAVVENVMAVPLGLPLLLPRRTPLVAIKHHFQGAAFAESQGLWRGALGRLLEAAAMPLAYRRVPLVVPSEKTAAEARRRGFGRGAAVHVVPPPVPPPPEAPGVARAEAPTVLYVGAVARARKRVHELVRAFEGARREVPAARLVIAGEGPDRDALEREASGADASGAVRFVGFVTEREKAEWMARAWAFGSASVHEGFGITWVEAGAAGLPVVGYRVPGLDTLDDSRALLVPPGDVGALSRALARVLTDAPLRQRLGAAARAGARLFDPEASARAFLDVVEAAVRARSGA